MSDQYTTALFRALLTGFFTAAVVFFTMLAQTQEPIILISATGVAFFTPFAVRFGGEGSVDTHRAHVEDAKGSTFDDRERQGR